MTRRSPAGSAHLIDPSHLDLRAPGWSRDLPRKPGALQTVQFQSLPPDSELEQIGAFIERHPDVAIRAYGGDAGSIVDLAFLRHFGHARHVAVDALFGLQSLDGLAYLLKGLVDQIEYLEFWMIRGFNDLSEVAGLTRLRYLFLQALKQVSALPDLSRCSRLERIRVHSGSR